MILRSAGTPNRAALPTLICKMCGLAIGKRCNISTQTFFLEPTVFDGKGGFNLVLCNKPNIMLVLQKKIAISVLKSTKREYRDIGIPILTTISVNIGLKWYYPV